MFCQTASVHLYKSRQFDLIMNEGLSLRAGLLGRGLQPSP